MTNEYRRELLKQTGLLGLGVLGAGVAKAADACLVTPAQTAGPYYPERGRRWEDEDLTVREGATGHAVGVEIGVYGQVTNGACKPVANAWVEIWQADVNGKYMHTQDRRPIPLDPNFQYWGRMRTNAEGMYSFKTIKPGKYPGRTPHIHFRVIMPTGETLITQLYFTEHALINRQDGIYYDLIRRGVADRVTIDLAPESAGGLPRGRFDISFGRGADSTPEID